MIRRSRSAHSDGIYGRHFVTLLAECHHLNTLLFSFHSPTVHQMSLDFSASQIRPFPSANHFIRLTSASVSILPPAPHPLFTLYVCGTGTFLVRLPLGSGLRSGPVPLVPCYQRSRRRGRKSPDEPRARALAVLFGSGQLTKVTVNENLGLQIPLVAIHANKGTRSRVCTTIWIKI